MLLQTLAAAVARHPDRILLQRGQHALDAASVWALAGQVAGALQRAGVQRGDRVGIGVPRSMESVLAVLGCLRAGAVYVPVDPTYPPERQAMIAEDAGLVAVVVTGPTPGWAARLPAVSVAVDVGNQHDLGVDEETGQESADDLLNVLYTSGSTGRPKGVVGTRAAMLNRLRWGWSAFPFGPDEVVAHRSSLNFVDAGPEIFGGLLMGVPTWVVLPEEQADLARFVTSLELGRVTRLTVVPSLLAAMLRSVPELGRRLSRLHTWICSGETLTLPLLQAFRASFPAATLINLYGTTEVTGDVTAAVFRPDQPLPTGTPPIGAAIAGAELLVLDELGARVEPGEAGELYVGGPVLARGYHQRPQEEAVRFPRHPDRDSGSATSTGDRVFRTGDRVRARPDGQLEYLGRSDSAVKLRGIKVDLEEIERCLLPECPEVTAMAAVLADGQIVLCVTPELSVDGPETQHIRATAARLLPEVMRPGRIVGLTRLPTLPNGKNDRHTLSGLVRSTARVIPDEERPQTPTERALANCWTTILRRTDVSRLDRFVQLGGDSLRLAELMITIEAELRPATRPDLGLVRDGTLAEVAAELDGTAPRSGPRATPDSARITLTPLGEIAALDKAVMQMVVEASHDAPLVAATELPGRMDLAAAKAWSRSREGVVIRVDGVPAGAGVVQRAPNVGVGVEVPVGAVQLDEWLHPAFRGTGLLGEAQAWPLLKAWLAERFETEISVVWADHLAMITILKARGYQFLGRTFWTSPPDGDGTSGPCEVWTYDLRASGPRAGARPAPQAAPTS